MRETSMNGLLETTSARALLNKLFQHDRSPEPIRAKSLPQRPNFDLETLESRLLLSADLSSIVWVNRGDASDNFASVFGANAPAARAVVDAAIDSWDRVITNFNYSDGTDHFDLTLS